MKTDVVFKRAYNDALAHTWMAADPRYYAAIVIPRDPSLVLDPAMLTTRHDSARG